MSIHINFNFAGQDYHLGCDRASLHRDYNDEPYALFFAETQQGIGYFEVNLLKDSENKILPEGYVLFFADTADDEPAEIFDANVSLS